MPRPQLLSGPAAAWSVAGLALLAAVAAPAAPTADITAKQPRAVHASAAPREAQYVFVVDDSGSMKSTDPNRLSVFAVRSLLGMLDDRDEVSVVRLNGPSQGEAPPPIEPLARNREEMLGQLDLGGPIARYGAAKTPCTVALRALHDLLARSYRSSAAQVVFFLTDGECDPPDFRDTEARAFLDGLPAHEAGMLQLHLLRFQGEPVTDALVSLAEATGGGVHPIPAGDPTAILHAFADALSRSQGYEAELLAPGDDRLPAHRGAERVRLLAVAPGEGEPLGFVLRDARGGSPDAVGRTRTGTHRFRDGEPFRFAALDYRPPSGASGPVTVAVSGAGSGAGSAWRVVAVPEYRLALSLALFRGPCDEPGERLRHAVERGAPVCAVAELRNAAGEVVTGAVTDGEIAASLTVRRPDRPSEEPRVFPANPGGGDAARYLVQRSGLEAGTYAFTPEVELGLSSGGAVALRGPTVALEVTAIEITPEPAELAFGEVVPGGRTSREIRFQGSFPRAEGHLEWVDRRAVPGCVTAELGDQREGGSQPILPDQKYTLALRIAAYCGPASFDEPFDTAVRLVFDQGDLPSVEVPVTFRLRSQIDPPAEVSVVLSAGEAVRVPVSIGGNFEGEIRLCAAVEPSPDGWPEDGEDLAIGLEGGEVVLEAGTVVPVVARAYRCCPGGTYRATLLLAPPPEDHPPGAEPPAPLAVPIAAEVLPGGFWTCWGPWIVRVLGGLLLLLVLLYLLGMYRNSRFLDPRQVADRLRPLVWTSFGGTEERRGVQDDVRRMVARGLPWLGRSGRIAAWLGANPLRFGLPGGRYEETLELRLVPSHDTAASTARLLAEPAFLEALRASPKEYWGRLFATARAGVTLVGVPDAGGLVSRLAPEGAAGAAGGGRDPESAPRPVTLRNTPLVRPLDPRERPEEGAAAGWRVG